VSVDSLLWPNDLHIIYSDGFYEGSLLKKKVMGRLRDVPQVGLRLWPGSAALMWRIGSICFLQIDNLAADAVARTLSLGVGKVADAQFSASRAFLHRSCHKRRSISRWRAATGGPAGQGSATGT